MTTYHWNHASGDWGFYPNWSPSTPSGPPGASDDAFIDLVTGTPYDVTVNSAESALSLTLNSADATLDINSSLTIGTTFSVTAGTVNLNSAGRIVGGTISGSGIVFNRGTLDGVTYSGTLDLSATNARVHVANGITLTDSSGGLPGDVLLTGDNSHIYVSGTQTLDNASINLGAGSTASSIYQIGSGLLTLGSGLAITHAGKYAELRGIASEIVNDGTIDAGLSGGRFSLIGFTFVNQGLIGISNGDVFKVFDQTFANTGTISLTSGGELHFVTKVSQTDPSRAIGYINNSGGTIFIERDFDNAGAVLTTGAGGLGSVVLAGTAAYGSIIGGTVTGSGMVFQNGTLSGVTYAGLLDLSASGAKVNIRNGITLTGAGGTGPGSVALTGNNSQMYFYQSETLDNAAVSIGGAASDGIIRQVGGGGTLTLGSGLTLSHTGYRALLYVTAYNSITNAGTIDAGLSGGRFVLYGDGVFANTGEIDISNGDFFLVTSYGGFTNSGLITLASGGELALLTSLTTADLGTVTNAGGTISVRRTLDNSGTVLTTGPTGIGRVVINAGVIAGGTIGGYDMGFLAGGMSGVTFVGPLDLSPAGSHTAVSNGITLVGAGGSGPGSILLTGDASSIYFTGVQTLDNVGFSIGGAGAGSFIQENLAGEILTFGPNAMITHYAGDATIFIVGGSTVVNNGTIDAAVNGGTFAINGSGTFTNQGIVGVTNGDLVDVLSTITGTGTFAVNGNGVLRPRYDFASTETVDFTGSAGHLILTHPNAFHGGIIGFQSGDTVDFAGIGLAASYTYSGGIVTLYNGAGGVLAQATLSTPTPSPAFTLSTDGGGGTVLGLASSIPGPVFYSTTAGVYLYYPSIQNPATIATAATITNTTGSHAGDAVYGTGTVAWSVYNYGTVEGTQVGSSGIRLAAGGDVHNGSTGVTTTRIAGDALGVVIYSLPGTVTNYGTIEATGAAGFGVLLGAGGRVDNGQFGASGALITGFHAVDIQGNAGTVSNDGTLAASGANSYGVRLFAGGDLHNGSAGLITGYRSVVIDGAGGTLINYGTIAGTRGAANLTGGAVLNGYLGGGGVLMTGYYGVFSGSGISVTNYGTISGTGPNYFGSGVNVGAGSNVTNGGLSQIGLITGYDGVRISGPSAALTNSIRGTIVSTGTGFGAQGVDFLSGGTLINNGAILGINTYASGINAGFGNDVIINSQVSGPAVIAGWLNDILQFSGIGTVSNSGTVSSSHGDAIYLAAGGTVSNLGGLISGYRFGVNFGGAGGTLYNFLGSITGQYGVVISGGPGTLVNTGTVIGTPIAGGSFGVALRAGGIVSNSALIEATGGLGVYIGGGIGSVVNSGTIASQPGAGYSYFGVYLRAGGNLTNQGPGLIDGSAGGVAIAGAVGTVTNYGTISDTGVYGDGVYLDVGGIVNDAGIIVASGAGVQIHNAAGTVVNTGAIAGVNDGVVISGASGTVSNLAIISASGNFGAAVYLADGGNITNGSSVVPTAAIVGYSNGVAIFFAPGFVTNYGTIASTGGSGYGAVPSDGGVVVNFGTISSAGSYGAGVRLGNGGSLTNGSVTVTDALIAGAHQGVEVYNLPGYLSNFGAILGYGLGVFLQSGGTLANYGTIASTGGGGYGVNTDGAAGLVLNYGTISGAGAGVWLEEGGTVANYGTIFNPGVYGHGIRISSYGGGTGNVINRGLISAPTTGVLASAPTSVLNYGTILGTDIYGGDGVAVIAYPGTVVNYAAIQATGRGVYLGAGGTVANQFGADIAGGSGVSIVGAAGTVANLGTVAGTYGVGVFLGAGGTVGNGSVTVTDALIVGPKKGIIAYGAASVVNFGTVAATINYQSAIYLVAGGSVDNRPGGLIDGAGTGVVISGAAGTVANLGSITTAYGDGVALTAGGTVANGLTGAAAITGVDGVVLINLAGTVINGASGSPAAVIDGATYGIFATDAAATVTNYGTITGTLGNGVFLHNGGVVTNANTGLISGSGGVQIGYAAGQLTNAGIVQAVNRAVYFSGAAGGSVFNNQGATIAGGDGIGILGPGTVVNLGAVTAAYSGFGVVLGQGGTVVNGSAVATGASIIATLRALTINGAAGTVANYGTIAATITYASGMYLTAGGSVINQQTGLIRGGGDGLDIAGALGLVINLGTIDGTSDTGVALLAGGTIVNGFGGATLATLSGASAGVELLNTSATIVNYGTISGYAGVVARAGGGIFNNRLITGYHYGALVQGGPGAVVNSAAITATGIGATGLTLQAGGAVYNSGTIAAGRNGIFFDGNSNIINHGLISGYGDAGIYAGAGVGVVANYGTIAALGSGATGVRLVGGSTLFNAGTVAGNGLSVYFIGGGNRLVIDPAAVFVGGVDAHLGAGDVIELAAGSGTLAGFNTNFGGFEQLVVDASASWQLPGPVTFGAGFIVTDSGILAIGSGLTNDGIIDIEAGAALSFAGAVGGGGTVDFNGAGASLAIGAPATMTNAVSGFAPTDMIDFVGIGLAASYSFTGGILRLNNSGGVQIAQVTLSTPVTNPHFILATDGSSGTLLGINALTGTFTGSYFAGIVLNDVLVQNPALATGTANITNNTPAYNGDALSGTSAVAWHLTNYGTINATATSSAGVRLQAGGTVVSSGFIAGGVYGIVIDTGVGQVINAGIVSTTDTNTGIGLALHAGGGISNIPGGAISGFHNGVSITGGAGALGNSGTIQNTSTTGGAAVYFAQGGLLINQAAGLITSYRTAISIKGAAGQIANYGTVQSTGTNFAGAYLGAGGNLTNAAGGTIVSNWTAVDARNAAGTVTNFGTIASNATVLNSGSLHGVGVILEQGGLVFNGPGGLIAAYETGVYLGGGSGIPNAGAVGTIVNYGTIAVSAANTSLAGSAVSLVSGGTVLNLGLIESVASTAVRTQGTVGETVVNFGTVAFVGGGTSGRAIALDSGGVVVNYGLLSGAANGDPIAGYTGVVRAANQAATVFNFGTITNPNNSNGVNLQSGGLLVNGAGSAGASGGAVAGSDALIYAAHGAVYVGGTLGVPTSGATGTLINYGTIQNTTSLAPAISMVSGGTLVNSGLVSSGRTGISFTNIAGTMDNFGTVVSTAPVSGTRGAGVYLGAGGTVTNWSGGLITAERAAVSLAYFGSTTASAVITNSGILSGATGVSIGAGDTGNNTIVNFGTITGTNGIAILLGGDDDEIVIQAYSQLNGAVGNFQTGDSFDLPFLFFSAAETINRDAGNVLRISQSGNLVYSIQLDPSQDFTGSQFRLANDGGNGTMVLAGPDTTPPTTQTRVLAVNANSGATPIGILAPSDPDDLPATLTVSVNLLPGDGTVVLADGVTPVTLGQTLSVDQLTGLEFIPTPNINGQSSIFSYTVSDQAGNISNPGTAFLGINLPPPPNSPSLINGLGGAEGFGENALPPNDDGSSAAIDITSVFGGALNFFSHPYSSLYLNNNGNITFNGPLGAFTPDLTTAGANNPIIAPFWADVDTRGGPGVPTGGNATGSNTVYWDLDTVNHVFTATWDDVGYFGGHTNKLDAFQLQLIDEGNGDFDIVFRYQAINWTTGDASGGLNGLNDPSDPTAVAAQAGFEAGDGINGFQLPQSGIQDEMLGLPSNPAAAGTLGATGETGVYRFQVRNGTVVPPPPPPSPPPTPPSPTGLVLAAISDSGQAGDSRTNVTTPIITGFGQAGDIVTLLDSGVSVGSATVLSDGTWAVMASQLGNGLHGLTATQANGGAVSLPSTALFVTIDLTTPVTTSVSLSVASNSGAAPIGLTAPTDADGAGDTLTIVVSALPSNGTVTIGGVTPVVLGQQLTASQLAGLDFAPGVNQAGTSSSFGYTVTDLAGNTSSGTATFAVTAPITVQLFDFLFTYNDGKDYYFGTVADGGNFGYQVGKSISTSAGHYDIFGLEGTTTQASGRVVVGSYSHGGIGQASPTPVKTGQGLADGSGGLGTETDAVLGIDGDQHPFSGFLEASFQTIPLWSFIYTYADGRAFYSGTVATTDTLSSRTITNGSGNVVGTYSVFQQGVTTRTAGTVIVDRLTLGGLSFIPLRGALGAINGQGGLGSELGFITVNGATLAFSDLIEPAVTVSLPTLPSTPPPSASDVITAEVNALYREVLGRNPDPSGLASYSAALAAGTSVASLRTLFARSSEAQNLLKQLYHQILGRDIDQGGTDTYTNALINGSSIAAVQLILAQSSEAQSDIQHIYQQVLGRDADAGGLTSYMAALGNANPATSLANVRNVIAHSGEAASDLSQLVVNVLHRSTFAAELVGMENEITTDGVTQQTLQSEMLATNTAGSYTVVFDSPGDSLLGAQPNVPTLFVFTDMTLAADTITGFDPTRDTIQLPSSVAPDFATIQSKTANFGSGSVITLNPGHTAIFINDVTPGSLGAANFRIV